MPTKDDLTTKYSTENLSQFIKGQPFITKEASKTQACGLQQVLEQSSAIVLRFAESVCVKQL